MTDLNEYTKAILFDETGITVLPFSFRVKVILHQGKHGSELDFLESHSLVTF